MALDVGPVMAGCRLMHFAYAASTSGAAIAARDTSAGFDDCNDSAPYGLGAALVTGQSKGTFFRLFERYAR